MFKKKEGGADHERTNESIHTHTHKSSDRKEEEEEEEEEEGDEHGEEREKRKNSCPMLTLFTITHTPHISTSRSSTF